MFEYRQKKSTATSNAFFVLPLNLFNYEKIFILILICFQFQNTIKIITIILKMQIKFNFCLNLQI